MKHCLVDILSCPECQGPLAIEATKTVFELSGETHIVDGILGCSRSHRFPVMDEIPRLILRSLQTADELAFLGQCGSAPRTKFVMPAMVEPEEVETRIRHAVASSYGLGSSSSAAQQARVASEIAYLIAEYRGDNKRKYADLLHALESSPTSILDVGGSLPGMLVSLSERFKLRCAVVADLDIRHAFAFKTASRNIALVRADARCLPFRRRSFDLAVSAFLLEHTPDWRTAVQSIMSVGVEALVAFGPNRWFPFEIGHLDAPLAGTLPKWMSSYVSYAWLKMTRRGRPLRRIQEILDGMTYISSRAFRRECRSLNATPRNVFPELIDIIARDYAAPPTAYRRVIQAWPRLSRALARALALSGIEPNVYHFVTASANYENVTPSTTMT